MKIVDVLGEDDDVVVSHGPTSGGTDRAIKNAYNAQVSTDLTSDSPNKSIAFNALNQYASQLTVALNAYRKNSIIWKGIKRSAAVILTDPTKIERTAANTYNYMNLLVSTLPSWKGFPPRNRSMISSTDKNIAMGYGSGSPYVVLPFGNPVIGECNGRDFWDSFNGEVYPPVLNRTLNTIGAHLLQPDPDLYSHGYAAIRSTNAKEFYEDLKRMDYALKREIAVNPGAKWLTKLKNRDGELMVKLLDPNLSFKEKLNELLDPRVHGFERSTMSNIEPSMREVWLSSPAILVKEEWLWQWLEHRNNVEL